MLATDHPGFDVVEDPLGVLRARIVRGRDRDISQTHGDLSHRRTFAAIAVAAGTEDDDHASAARRDFPNRLERTLQRVGCVRVIAQDDAGIDRDTLHPARDLWSGR